jgi:hypothetical protein
MQPFAAPTAMKKISLAVMLFSLVFSVACGSNGINGLIGTGHYSNSSLTGNYVYQIAGTDLNTGSSYSEAGVFAANGSGTITSGEDDVAETSGPALDSATTGTYSVQSDGTGVITLNNTGFGTIELAITLASTSKAYAIEADALNSTGVIEKQNFVALPTTATAFVFKDHGVSSIQDFSNVGQFTMSATGSLSGSNDVNRNGTVDNGTTAAVSLLGTSSFAAPDTSGRGTAIIADATGTTDFVYYVVDANNIRLFISDVGVVGLGRVEAQTGAPFTTDPLSGNSYAFGSKADDNAGTGAVDTVGSFTASSGAITGGTLDSTVDGATSYANVSFTGGSYSTVSGVGRTAITSATAIPSTVTQAFWMVNPARAFFLTLSDSSDPSKIEDGTADEQQGAFSTSSLNGQYAFSMDGIDLLANGGSQTFVDRVGWIQWNGNGGLTWNENVNSNGTINSSGALSGTYTVSSDGRTAATVNDLSYSNNDIVFYLVSGSNAYILENDAGVQINGMMNQQQ